MNFCLNLILIFLKKFEHFFEIRPNMELAADIEVIKQKINTNRYWYNRSLETVQKWLVGLRQSE